MKSFFILLTVCSCTVAACNSSSSDAPKSDTLTTSTEAPKTNMQEKNKETALASEAGLNNHSIDEVFKDAAPDFTDYGNGSAPPVKGLDSSKAMFKVFLTAFPDIKGENLMAIADGNHVAIFGDWSGTFKSEMMGMKPTGKSFKVKDVDLFTFNDDGKITEHRSVQANESMLLQLGVNMKK